MSKEKKYKDPSFTINKVYIKHPDRENTFNQEPLLCLSILSPPLLLEFKYSFSGRGARDDAPMRFTTMSTKSEISFLGGRKTVFFCPHRHVHNFGCIDNT